MNAEFLRFARRTGALMPRACRPYRARTKGQGRAVRSPVGPNGVYACRSRRHGLRGRVPLCRWRSVRYATTRWWHDDNYARGSEDAWRLEVGRWHILVQASSGATTAGEPIEQAVNRQAKRPHRSASKRTYLPGWPLQVLNPGDC